ncbi:TPA: toll/interleukin-1 receptor domain-containing protein [Streptococcus suis]
MDKCPKVFISYSWDSDSHIKWVKQLSDKLRANGIDSNIDQDTLVLGDRLPEFMEKQITDSDFVLIVCTKNYKEKADSRKNCVGYEGHIISGEIFSLNNERKFIPILKENKPSEVLPTFLSGKLGVHLPDSINEQDKNFQELLATIFNVNKKPVLGKIPNFVSLPKEKVETFEQNEVRIIGFVEQEISAPKMDGSPGCALYKIPFKLNTSPNREWCNYFLESWRRPPKWTSMHRFNIAKVAGDKIILDGTTMEEVKEYHLATLKLCIQEANLKYRKSIEFERVKRDNELKKLTNHYDNVNKILRDIEF